MHISAGILTLPTHRAPSIGKAMGMGMGMGTSKCT